MDRTADELKQQLESQREEVGRDLVVIGDRISPSRMAERGQARMRRRVQDLRDRVMGTVDAGRSQVGGTAHGIAEGAREAPEQVTRRVEGNPLAAGLVAFGAGLLAASILPGTRREAALARQTQPVLEEAAATAADRAREVAEDLRPVAQEELGSLGEEAREAARATTSAAREQVQEARGEMSGAPGTRP